MIETKLISISKPRRTYSQLVIVEEFDPEIKAKVKRIELKRIPKSAICCACDMGIKEGTPHKTAQVVAIDKENKTSKTRHLPLHVHCEFKS